MAAAVGLAVGPKVALAVVPTVAQGVTVAVVAAVVAAVTVAVLAATAQPWLHDRPARPGSGFPSHRGAFARHDGGAQDGRRGPLPMENRLRLRLQSLAWALTGAAVAAAITAPITWAAAPQSADPPWFLLDPILRSGGCGFFYGLLAFHLQRVDPDDGHLQAGLVGAVCGIRSLAAPAGLALGPAAFPGDANLWGLAPSLMMGLARAWLPLWVPVVGSALLLHGIRRLTPALLSSLRPSLRP